MRKLYLSAMLLSALHGLSQNVGIGTNSPATPLHIKSTTAEVLRLESNTPYISFFNGSGTYSGYLWYNHTGAAMELGTPFASNKPVVIAPNVSPVAHFTPNGRVGINTATPTERLDVNGIVNLRGIKINGDAGAYGQVYVSGGPSIAPQWKSMAFSNNVRCAVDFSSTGTCCATNISSTKYNLSPGDITIGSNQLTINKSGLYRFEGDYQGLIQGSGFSALPEGSFTLYFTGGVETAYNLESFAPFRLRTAVTNNYVLNGRFSVDVHITAPTNVQLLRSFLTSGGSTTYSAGTGSLFVHLISD